MVKLDHVDKVAFTRDWNAGLTLIELSIKHGISRTGVSEMRHRLKLSKRETSKAGRFTKAQIAKAYKRGGSRAVMDDMGVTRVTAYVWLRKHGIITDAKTLPRRVINAEQFKKDYAALTLEQLVKKYKSYSVVTYWRTKLKLPYKQNRRVKIPMKAFLREYRAHGLAHMSKRLTVPIQHLCYWRDKYLMEEKCLKSLNQ